MPSRKFFLNKKKRKLNAPCIDRLYLLYFLLLLIYTYLTLYIVYLYTHICICVYLKKESSRTENTLMINLTISFVQIIGRECVYYFHDMIVEMTKWGFQEGKTLFGFGYDFRQSNRYLPSFTFS